MPKLLKHIFIENNPETLKYTTTRIGRNTSVIPDRIRQQHSQRILTKFDDIWNQQQAERNERQAVSLPTRKGTYLEFKSASNADLITKSLEDMRRNIRLLNIRAEESEDGSVHKATVYIPEGNHVHFLKKIQDYSDVTKDLDSGRPKNAPLVESIEDIELALVESLWTDDNIHIPGDEASWCEVWLRVDENIDFNKQLETFQHLLKLSDITYKGNALHFPERAVLLINADKSQLTYLIKSSDQLAEFRIGQEAASFWSDERNIGQNEWAEDLIERLEIEDTNVKICILDSGINHGHQLINPMIDDGNCLTVNPEWGSDDVSQIAGPKGHGTMMAGIAAYGDLQGALETAGSVKLTHKICSVKILPRVGDSQPENWGDYTEQAIYRAESVNTDQVILFCMAVTSSVDVDRGKPSSWSGMIDTISFGDDQNKRLFIVSGGNNRDQGVWNTYPEGNKLVSVENPAQSWNALTVGAYTEKILVDDDDFSDYNPMASLREMSPYNSTSSLWYNKWPIKPEIVLEGGNILRGDNDDHESDYCQHPDVEVLTTSKNFQTQQFDTFNGTSSATAKASWLAARIAYKYPNIWSESIRGLMVHSASWSDELIRQFSIDLSKKRSVLGLLRVCGYGIPDYDRALNSFENGLTLIAQEEIQPFIKTGSSFKTNDMQLFDFPWPKDELLALGETPVKLKITLSYFIEPGPGQIGWKDKYRYQSHGLRFDVNKVGETAEEFKKRINKAARDEDYESESVSDNRWLIGKDNRSSGSIHSDKWEDIAANIADCNLIAVYPVIGWWRERHNLNRCNTKTRYSLLVSLETPNEEVELYSVIENIISTPVTIEVDTGGNSN